MTSYTTTLTEKLQVNDSFGKPDQTFVFVYDTTSSKWIEVEGVEYFKVEKRLNQMSKFTIDLPQIEAAQKLYVKEYAKVLLISNNFLVLKGRIQKVNYETSYSCTIEGFGMEAVILDKEYRNATRSPEDEDRVQYENISAQLIAKELLSTNHDGVAPWTMKPRTYGLFATDYGQISVRYEYANKLTALGNLSNSLNYDWWIDHDPISYANDYFNMASIKGNQTNPATDANRQFTITGAAVNAEGTDYQRDVTNIANYVKIQGYGDGLNQLFTSTYNASPTWTTLSANITASATTISLTDASAFASSGTVRIAEEIITYTGKSVNNLTGCTRGTSGTIAKIHRKGCYIEKYVIYSSPEANSSLYTNGLMELTLTYRDVLDESTLELIATKELINRMNPIERITITPSDPQQVAETLQTGDLISIIDAESSLNSNYRIVGLVYENNYGNLSLIIEASNKSLTFIEQMQKEREANQALQKYMQGSTNIYCIPYAENIDNSHPGYLRFYLPPDSVALNRVKLSFKMKNYRADSSSITVAPAFKPRNAGWYSNGHAFNKGNFSTGTYISSLSTTSNCVSNLSLTQSTAYYPNFTGSWWSYSPSDFVDVVNSSGVVTSWWNTTSGQTFIAATGWSNSRVLTGYSFSNNSLVSGWSSSGNVVNGWTNITWNDPVFTRVTAPNLSGTFNKIKVTATVHNGFNDTKNPTIYLKRETAVGSGAYTTIGTYTPSMGPYSYYFIDYEDTVDYTGYSYKVEVPLTGFNVNQTSSPDSSYITLQVITYVTTADTIVFGIYENSAEFTPPGTIIVTAGTEGAETTVGTYTADQVDLDITNKIPNTPGWYVVKLNSNHANNSSFGGRMRLESDLYVQMFIESK